MWMNWKESYDGTLVENNIINTPFTPKSNGHTFTDNF